MNPASWFPNSPKFPKRKEVKKSISNTLPESVGGEDMKNLSPKVQSESLNKKRSVKVSPPSFNFNFYKANKDNSQIGQGKSFLKKPEIKMENYIRRKSFTPMVNIKDLLSSVKGETYFDYDSSDDNPLSNTNTPHKISINSLSIDDINDENSRRPSVSSVTSNTPKIKKISTSSIGSSSFTRSLSSNLAQTFGFKSPTKNPKSTSPTKSSPSPSILPTLSSGFDDSESPSQRILRDFDALMLSGDGELIKSYVRNNAWSVDQPVRSEIWVKLCSKIGTNTSPKHKSSLIESSSAQTYESVLSDYYPHLMDEADDNTQMTENEEMALPVFIDSKFIKHYHLNEKGKMGVKRVVTVIEYLHPDITYAPQIYATAALFLHYLSETETYSCLQHLLCPRLKESFIIQSRTAFVASGMVLLDLCKKHASSTYDYMADRIAKALESTNTNANNNEKSSDKKLIIAPILSVAKNTFDTLTSETAQDTNANSRPPTKINRDSQEFQEILEGVFAHWMQWIYRDLPFEYLVKVMDCYLVQGLKVLYRVALAILILYRKEGNRTKPQQKQQAGAQLRSKSVVAYGTMNEEKRGKSERPSIDSTTGSINFHDSPSTATLTQHNVDTKNLEHEHELNVDSSTTKSEFGVGSTNDNYTSLIKRKHNKQDESNNALLLFDAPRDPALHDIQSSKVSEDMRKQHVHRHTRHHRFSRGLSFSPKDEYEFNPNDEQPDTPDTIKKVVTNPKKKNVTFAESYTMSSNQAIDSDDSTNSESEDDNPKPVVITTKNYVGSTESESDNQTQTSTNNWTAIMESQNKIGHTHESSDTSSLVSHLKPSRPSSLFDEPEKSGKNNEKLSLTKTSNEANTVKKVKKLSTHLVEGELCSDTELLPPTTDEFLSYKKDRRQTLIPQGSAPEIDQFTIPPRKRSTLSALDIYYEYPNIGIFIARYCQDVTFSPDKLLRIAFGIRGFRTHTIDDLTRKYEKYAKERVSNFFLAAKSFEDQPENRGLILGLGSQIPPPPYTESELLSRQSLRYIWSWIPTRYTMYVPYKLFSTQTDGISLRTFFARVDGEEPTMLIIKTTTDQIFGAYLSCDWKQRSDAKANTFFGTGETFVFTLKPKHVRYEWIGMSLQKNTKNAHQAEQQSLLNKAATHMFQSASNERLLIGGGSTGHAIQFNGSLESGITQACETFNSPPLLTSTTDKSNSGSKSLSQQNFDVSLLEVFAFK